MSLLDTIIDNHENGIYVVSEQHDPNAINFVAGLSDPGEMIRCGYLPQLRRHQGEQDAEYAERIRPIVMALPQDQRDMIMGAAKRRAAIDRSNGRISAAFAGKPAWHGLGTVVSGAMTSAEARRLANLEWRVEKLRLAYKFNGREITSEDAYAIVRADTGEQLGTVGSRYQPIQNDEAFDYLDNVLGEYGAQYESAGAVFGGKRVWMLANMPKLRFDAQPGDTVESYLLMTNCHDGCGSAVCMPTTVRVECANTLRIATRKRGSGISIRHTGDVRAKVRDARDAIGISNQAIGEYRDACHAMVRTKADITHYANDVLDAVLDITAAEAQKGADLLGSVITTTQAARDLECKAISAKIEKRSEILNDILERYDSERCRPRGSLWAAFNAVTESADHRSRNYQSKEVETRLSRRFDSILTGAADEMKQAAYFNAKAMMAT